MVRRLNLQGVTAGRQVGHVDRKLVLVTVPNLGVPRPADHTQQRPGEDHSTGCLQTRELDQPLGHLTGVKRGTAFPRFLPRVAERGSHPPAQLQHKKVYGPVGSILVPALHRVVAPAEIALVEPHRALPEPALRILHSLLLVCGPHLVSRPEPVYRTQVRLRHHREQRLGGVPF